MNEFLVIMERLVSEGKGTTADEIVEELRKNSDIMSRMPASGGILVKRGLIQRIYEASKIQRT